jgi:hypothetical protein
MEGGETEMTEFQKRDKLKEAAISVNSNVLILNIGIVIGIAFISTFIFFEQPVFVLFGIIFLSICVALANSNKKDKTIFESGLEGEKILKQTLKKILPDNHTVFYNVSFNGSGDVDCIVVSPSGIYILEAKHHSGEISYTENGWTHLKISRRGNKYYNENFRNPMIQLDNHIFKARKFFNNNGVNVWIKGIIVFTNSNISLSLQKQPNAFKVVTIDKLRNVFAGDSRVNSQKNKKQMTKIIELLKNIQ